MELDAEDPLGVFSGSPSHPCIGVWKNDVLQVEISLQGGRLTLVSGKTELLMRESGPSTWSVASSAKPDVEVYIAAVRGYGHATHLTLQPPRHRDKGGSDKKAVLRRVEHLAVSPPAPPPAPARARAESRDAADGRDESESYSPERGGGACASGRGRRGRRRRAERSPSAASRAGRSRSAGRGGRSPPRRRPQGDGNGEEITTIFVTGLPDDVREDDVRDDLEEAGPIVRVVLMRRGSERNAFVRFEKLSEAEWAMDRILSGKLKVNGGRCKAEMARRNTN